MIRFESITEAVRKYQPDAEIDFLRRAYVLAAKAHGGQTRRSGEPYLSHPLEVAAILAGLRLDVVTVACGLLHDVVEDTEITAEELERRFGRDVRRIIEGLTKLSKVEFATAEANQAENVRKMVVAMTDDIRVILIKLADRLHNMRTLGYLREQKQRRIATETIEVYAPLAGRLGMGLIEAELQNLSLRYLEPQTYDVLHARVRSKSKWANDFIRDITRTLKRRLQAEDIPGEISGRTKSIYSIYQKMQRQDIELDQMYDFIALRLVTDTVPHCYAALCVIHNTWTPIPGRIKDFIAMPRPNGYRSLHTSLFTESGTHFEVQIRTAEMHRVAEDGIAAHWGYKSSAPQGEAEIKNFAWLRQVLEWQKEVDDPHEFLSSLKIDLYPEEVHCFTPKGEVKTFPRGATPIDFAYAIHTEVGHECHAARVNGAMVGLDYPLRNGDICEIRTRKNGLPDASWLRIARTHRAKRRIQARLNVEARRESIAIGRKLLDKEARAHDLSLRRIKAAEGLEKVLGQHGCSDLEDLFAAIGYGKVSATRALAACFPKAKFSETPPSESGGFRATVRRIIGRDPGQIQVRGHGDTLVQRAPCCSPVPGEAITGYLTEGKGVSVHNVNCPRLSDLIQDPNRKVAVSWKSTTGIRHDTDFVVKVENRKGVLADITRVIAEADTDIRTVRATADEDRQGTIQVTVAVENAAEVDVIGRTLRGVPGVIAVRRGGGGNSPAPDA